MATKPRHVPVNVRVLTVMLVIAIPVLAIGGFVVASIGRAQLRVTHIENLGGVAERLAASVDSFFFRQIVEVSILAQVPDVRAAAAAGGQRPYDVDTVARIDKEWVRLQAPPPGVEDILTNPASRFLRDVTRTDDLVRELLLTDRFGRLVAASNIVSDYSQADEAWWRNTFTSNYLNISDVRWDESARTYAVEISAPVMAPDTNDVAGVFKAVLDARAMLTAIGGTQFGSTGEAALVRKDGTVVYSRAGIEPGAQYFAAALLREALGQADENAPVENRAVDPLFRAAFSARTPQGDTALVVAAPTQLGASRPDLSWLVAVSQSEAVLFAPARTQVVNFAVLLAVVALAVLVCALWVSVRMATPADQIDLNLVEHAKKVRQIDDDPELES